MKKLRSHDELNTEKQRSRRDWPVARIGISSHRNYWCEQGFDIHSPKLHQSNSSNLDHPHEAASAWPAEVIFAITRSMSPVDLDSQQVYKCSHVEFISSCALPGKEVAGIYDI